MILEVEAQVLSSKRGYVDLAKLGTPEHDWERWYKLREGDIYVEAGAFWGRYGRIASIKVGSKGKVILIEPSPMNIQTIKQVIESEGLRNIMIVPKAVWSSSGRTQFCIYGNPAGHRIASSADITNFGEDNVIEVEMDTVDNILDELGITRVDLLAADVEGAEVEMIEGSEKYLRQKKILHVAVAAYHAEGGALARPIMNILKQHGYKGVKYEKGIVFGYI